MVDNFILDLSAASIDGESQIKGYEKKIGCESWSWGAHQQATYHNNMGGTAALVNIFDLNLVKKMDIASPLLMFSCWTGKPISTAKFTLLKQSNTDMIKFYVITMTDAIVSSINPAGSNTGDAVPRESVSFNFRKVQIEYTIQQAGQTGGPVKQYIWDIPGNQQG